MKRKNNKGIIPLLGIVLLSGCASIKLHEPEKAKTGFAVSTQLRPDWINNPGNGVSVSAGTHVRGEQAQLELATSRAREELAKRQGVTVSSEHNIAQAQVGGHLNSTAQKNIQEVVNQKEARGTVKAKWKDPQTDVLWVWLVPTD